MGLRVSQPRRQPTPCGALELGEPLGVVPNRGTSVLTSHWLSLAPPGRGMSMGKGAPFAQRKDPAVRLQQAALRPESDVPAVGPQFSSTL